MKRKFKNHNFEIILFLALGLPMSGYSQTVKATTIISPSPISKGVSLAPQKTRVIHMRKHREEVPSGGLSSANAPEKYIRKVMFNVPNKELEEKYGSSSKPAICVDSQEDVYLTFANAVVEFDKDGKQVKALKKEPFSQDGLLVDENGNICIYNRGSPSLFLFYGTTGNLIGKENIPIKKPAEADRFVNTIAFERGVIYSKKVGEIFHKLPGADEKNIVKKILIPSVRNNFHGIQNKHFYKKNGQEYQLPDVIDGFSFSRIIDVDSSGDIYVLYDWNPEPITEEGSNYPDWTPTSYHTYKFDSEGHLLAGFDFAPDYINPGNGTLYKWEGWPSPKFVKWGKTK